MGWGWANYDPQTESGSPPVFINKVLFWHITVPLCCFVFHCFCFIVAEVSHLERHHVIQRPFTESLLTLGLNHNSHKERERGAENVAQLVKCLLSTHEALGLILSMAQTGQGGACLESQHSGCRGGKIRCPGSSLTP